MEQSEAISLLTGWVIDISQLSQEDVSLLHELAQDTLQWPLLLSLKRGQLYYFVRQDQSSHKDVIKHALETLNAKGITTVDETITSSGTKFVVKFCIESTFQALPKTVIDYIKSLIFWTGIGISLPLLILEKIWKTSKHETYKIIDTLCAYGLIQITDCVLPPNNQVRTAVYQCACCYQSICY